MGNISLSHGAILDVLADAAGTVRIRGGEFVMTDATLLADTGNVPGAPDAIDINLTGNLVISSAAVPALTARTTGAGDAGEIKISAKNIDITGTGFGDFTPFAVIDTHTSASGKAGNVTITATDNLTMTGDPADFVFAIDSGTIGTDGGQGGNVTLNAKNIDIQYASISTGDFVANGLGEEATGSGGSLTITADTVGLTSSSLVTDGFFAGKGGDLTISARDIQINQNSALSTGGVQQAGAIRITTDQLVVDESSFEVDNEAGPSGGVTIIGKKIEFTNGSTIGSQTFGDEAAGDIKITATEHLMFSDDPNTDGGSARPSGLFTNSLGNAGPLGNAGAIVVITPSLEITGGARIDSTTRTSGQGGPITITTDTISISGGRPDPIFETQFNQGGLASGIYSRTVGSKFCAGPCGSAGSISITNDVFDLTQGAQINSVTTSTGRGGDITISAAQSVALSDRASLTVSSTGPGNAGNIEINAGNLFAMTNSSLTAEASQAGGGAIKITTNPGGTVQLFNSLISASVLDGMGGGGSVNIDPQYVILQNSQILAQAVQGPGGKIKINITNGGLFLPDANSLLSASSQFGVSGTVTIQSPNAPISGHIQPLGATPLIATSLLNQHCAALAGGQFSSFTVAGRDSLPTEPGSWLASPLYAGGVEPRLKAEGVQAEGMSASAGQVVSSEWMGDGLSGVSGVVRAGLVTHQTDQIDKLDQTDQFLFSLRQIAPAGFLTQAFAGDRSAGCRS
jgi:large exoprotein involved in heme utilization and adhesion